jgi:hypothetical protein
MQVQQLLQQQLGPQLEVVPSQYPPPLWRQALAQVLGVVQMGALGGVVAGEKIFEAAGVPVPEWWVPLSGARRGGRIGGQIFLGGQVGTQGGVDNRREGV